jgi:hypothetical protein
MANVITNSKKSDLKKRFVELTSKREELKFLVGLNVDRRFGVNGDGSI